MTTHQLHANPTQAVLFHVLETLHTLSAMQARIDASSLAHRLGTTPTTVALALIRLEQLGLADATRARLTLRGLAVATAHAAERERASLLQRVA